MFLLSKRASIVSMFATIFFALNANATDVQNGKRIFQEHCSSCHTGGIKGFFSGAPNVKKPSEWREYTNKGVDKMIAITMDGGEKMDPKGDCEKCSEQDIKDSVAFIFSNVDAKK